MGMTNYNIKEISELDYNPIKYMKLSEDMRHHDREVGLDVEMNGRSMQGRARKSKRMLRYQWV